MDRFLDPILARGAKNVSEATYQEGITLLQTHQDDPTGCETLLHQMLFLWPRRPELYYFQGCMALRAVGREGGTCAVMIALSWFQRAFHEFYRDPHPENWHPYHIENLLDFFKLLFDHHYTDYISHVMEAHVDLFQILSSPPVDLRWLLFLGAFYIKTNQLNQADRIYAHLLSLEPASRDLDYKICNNCLILYTRMARFNELPWLLKRRFDVCHAMLEDPAVEFATKVNVYCSNMLQYDYMYHDPTERQKMVGYVDAYFPGDGEAETSPRDFSDMAPEQRPPSLSQEPRRQQRQQRSLRLGYLSSDFVGHAVSHFILPILAHHDVDRFAVVLFATQNYAAVAADPVCQRHCVVNLQHLSTKDAAAYIRGMSIDILVDLNGYTEGHRLDVLAYRPAPVQVAYLGFPNTVGSARLCQYRLTDHLADLPESRQWFAEERVYLDRRGFLLYRSLAQDRPLPFRDGNSPFFPWTVLGALNRESKNSDAVLACWRTILMRAAHTMLLIKLSTVEDDAHHRAKYRAALAGVAEDRVVFVPYGSTADYFQLFSVLDVVLDTFPYAGTTTTCNALYNSVPVVTMAHRDLHAHNVSAAIVARSGFPELVAWNPDEYVDKAVALAMDTARRAAYRGNEAGPGTIHRGFVASMEAEPFMEDYEAALEKMGGQGSGSI